MLEHVSYKYILCYGLNIMLIKNATEPLEGFSKMFHLTESGISNDFSMTNLKTFPFYLGVCNPKPRAALT